MTTFPYETRNQIELIEATFFGSDLRHGLAAWTSTSREISEEKLGRLAAFLKFLADEDHATPFEKSYIEVLVRTDIATHIHILKHRIGVSVNAESARYKELKTNFGYVPADFPDEIQQIYEVHYMRSYALYHATLEKLTPLLGRQRAKESARMCLPYGGMIVANVSFNFRSFAHFLHKRYDKHAQLEDIQLCRLILREMRKDGSFAMSLDAVGFSIAEQEALDNEIIAHHRKQYADAQQMCLGV